MGAEVGRAAVQVGVFACVPGDRQTAAADTCSNMEPLRAEGGGIHRGSWTQRAGESAMGCGCRGRGNLPWAVDAEGTGICRGLWTQRAGESGVGRAGWKPDQALKLGQLNRLGGCTVYIGILPFCIDGGCYSWHLPCCKQPNSSFSNILVDFKILAKIQYQDDFIPAIIPSPKTPSSPPTILCCSKGGNNFIPLSSQAVAQPPALGKPTAPTHTHTHTCH